MNNSKTTSKEKHKLYSENSESSNWELFAGELHPLSCTCPSLCSFDGGMKMEMPNFKNKT